MNEIQDSDIELEKSQDELKKEFLKYVSFYPVFIAALLTSILIVFIFIRYTPKEYYAESIIEILDKAQDSEMALPTAMTVFNRSMINIENEIGTVSSYDIHSRVVKKLNSNIKYFKSGDIKTVEVHKQNFFKDYSIEYKVNLDEVSRKTYKFKINDNSLEVKSIELENSEIEKTYNFENLSTFSNKHDLPFEIQIFDYDKNTNEWAIEFNNQNYTIETFKKNVDISSIGKESDQLKISLVYPNRIKAQEYISTLVTVFDNDGIQDRKLEYDRTIEFVDTRSSFIEKELEVIELRRQKFKENNELVDIKTDASLNINQRFIYDAELFKSINQSDLASLLKETITENSYEIIPVNIGLESENINELIIKYNDIINERNRYLISAGENNFLVKNLNAQLDKYSNSIIQSIDNYISSLNVKINSLKQKESEFSDYYSEIPENEKILRAIERELEIKESLFLLLLQKREEAAINNAVVKPSIKIIDSARSSIIPFYPNVIYSYSLAIVISQVLVFIVLFVFFYFDNKIHTKSQLLGSLGNDMPILAEVPHVSGAIDFESVFSTKNARSPLAESIRILVSNLKFVFFNKKSEKEGNILLVTSSVKGEGKTLISSNTAKALTVNDQKVLLIGADLRNPQLHKFLDVEKSEKGLSDYIYDSKLNWREFLFKERNLDILLSGTIPPNPTEMLSSQNFKNFIEAARKEYDYVVIDSAPCLLVSDTFEISNYADATLYVVRSNYSTFDLCDFIIENKRNNKLKNINLILNAVGNSQSYGYKYSYQYGYKYGYGYKYSVDS